MGTKIFLLEDSVAPLMMDIAEHGIPEGVRYIFVARSSFRDKIESLVESIIGNFKALGRNISTQYIFLESEDPYFCMDRILTTFTNVYKNDGKFELHITGALTVGIYAYTIAILVPWFISSLYLYTGENKVISFPLLHLVNPMLMKRLAATILNIIDDVNEVTEDILAAETRKDRSTISRMVRALIESGLVDISPGRPRKIFLSPMGKIIARILKCSEKFNSKQYDNR